MYLNCFILLFLAQRVTEPNITMSTSTMDNDVNLFCWLDGFSPKKISVEWYKGNTLLTEKAITKIFESLNNGEKTFNARSQLSINAEQWNDGTEIACQATHYSKIFNKTWSKCKAEPTSKPLIRLEKPALKSVLTDSEVTASCVVETVLNTRVSWFLDGSLKTDRVTMKTLDGRTFSNLTISTNEWKKLKTIQCTAKHPCFDTVEKTINITEPVQKTPTLVIRRNLADILKGDSAVLECAARDLPSGELSVTFQANGKRVLEPQYVDLPKGVDTLTVRFTVPTTHRNKNQQFTFQIQQNHSIQWTSNSIENLFDDPSVELLVISSLDKSASAPQKLLCAATGLNPKIKWLPESVVNALSALSTVTVDSDGRLKVFSEISVPQQQWNNRVTFTCQVSDQDSLKPVEKSTNACAVTPDFAQKAQVYLLAPSISDMRANDHVSVTCLLLGHRLNDFSIVWKIGKDITSHGVTTQPLSVHSNGTESVRSVLKVSAEKWNASTTVSCEVTHFCSSKKMEHTIFKTKASDLKRPTIRILSPSDNDLSRVRITSLLCFIDGFRPADISVHWELNGSRLDASHFTNSPVGIRSAWSDYSMYSALILPGSKREDGTFSCVVQHESSKKPIRNSINNIYASVNENAPSVELLQGQNKLVCLVYGYSPSAINITWLLNSVSVQHNDSTNSSAKRPDGKFSIKSHLEVKASEWAPGDNYTCHVKHITGIITRNISKKEFTEESIYFDENMSETSTLDQAEETWNMACAFIILFIISLLYGCSVTLVKVKIA
ncbi:hypothetical protein AMELA_G00021500 [Ameiurus melas]|uniref:Ig-like domain-containing protein n=1 Tax=Ameiurus melas TaxID=219545 RepID=A0A7J6BBP5_AMEME|nr:hypothetical protein AMELA_G00021500 [Ameiurus melas]